MLRRHVAYRDHSQTTGSSVPSIHLLPESQHSSVNEQRPLQAASGTDGRGDGSAVTV